MIHESSFWKSELEKHLNTLQECNWCEDDATFFEYERAIFYSAFIVRKLIENAKVTDKVALTMTKVDVYQAIPNVEDTAMRRALNRFEFGTEFGNSPSSSAQIKVQKLANELIHSHAFFWTVDEGDSIAGIIVSSYNNEERRAIFILLEDWLSILRLVVADAVLGMHLEKNFKNGKVTKKLY